LSSLILAYQPASAQAPIESRSIVVPTSERQVSVTQYPAADKVKHPSVLLLHGYGCIDACASAFARYAQGFTDGGADAYVVEYYSDHDLQMVKGAGLNGTGYVLRFRDWTRLVKEVAHFIASQPRSNGQIALVGFSQGGRLAIASAANNKDIAALVVLYARLPRPDELHEKILQLPPTLILHGSADNSVPLSDGKAVFQKAQALGNFVEMAVYPGVGHGFDFEPAGTAAEDARDQVFHFIHRRLN
jgi:carboxymethylenebutenolidase